MCKRVRKIFMDCIINFCSNNLNFYIWLGAVIGHTIIGYSRNFHGLKPWLKRIIPNRKDWVYEVLDVVVLPFIALAISHAIINPITLAGALSTGLTWNTTLASITKKGRTARKVGSTK